MISRSTIVRSCFVQLALCCWLPLTALAQQIKPVEEKVDALAPIYVTTRIFQITAPRGSYQDVSDQVFRMKTSSLADEDKWMSVLKKTYPEFSAALLQTNTSRLFRTAKSALVTFGQWDSRLLQIQMNAAHSYGDGVTPGTQLVPDIGLHFGNDRDNPPITIAITPLDVESGLTYFFATPKSKMNSKDYTGFIRHGAPETAFANTDVILVFAFSTELDRPAAGPRQLNEQQSAALLKEAPKKVQPELTEELKKAGLGGKIQVRVEINAEGRVTRAITHNSTFPEMNKAAVAAARQWEFSPALFAENKDPISGLLTFEFPGAAVKMAEPKQSSSN